MVIDTIVLILSAGVLYFAGMWYYSMIKVLKMQNCKHEYEIVRICMKCGNRQRAVK